MIYNFCICSFLAVLTDDRQCCVYYTVFVRFWLLSIDNITAYCIVLCYVVFVIFCGGCYVVICGLLVMISYCVTM
jgi:hypothetical protein